MQKFSSNVQNSSGQAVAQASVLVKDAAGNPATIFSGNNSVALVNPIVTGADGEYAFYAENGRYSLTISAPGFVGDSVSDILLYDPAEAYTPIDATISNSAASAFASAQAAATSASGADADKTQTGADRIATGNDRTQTGLDVTSANTSAANASASATAAANSAASINAANLLTKDGNLSGIVDVAAARSNIGLGSAVDQLSSLTFGTTNRGAWAATTAYAVKDVVSDAGTWYICVTAHTSGATFDTTNWHVYQGVIADDLAASTGAAQVGMKRTSLANAVTTSLALWHESSWVNAADFGILGDGSDDSDRIQNALNSLNSAGGGTLLLPTSTCVCSKNLNIYKNTTLLGFGRHVSVLQFTHTGDGINSTWAINGSTAVNIRLQNLDVTCTNGSNAGGGFVDIGGSFVDLGNVYFSGWKYGVIFDQTEISTVKLSEFKSCSAGGIWLVNGDDHTTGASLFFTNRITISENQFNACPISVIDDGGYVHHIYDNNFNGGTTQIRVAGCFNIIIGSNEMEAATSGPIALESTTYNSGTGVGGSVLTVEGNTMTPGASGCLNITGAHAHRVVSQNNEYTGAAGAKIIGVANCATFVSISDACASGPFTDVDSSAGAPSVLAYGLGVYVQNGTTAPLVVYKATSSGGGAETAKFDLQANNNSNARVTYAGISSSTTGNGAGTESGSLNLKTVSSGTYATRWSVLSSGGLLPATDNTYPLGGASNRVSVVYAGTGTINTSDEREKQDIADIDAAAIRAVKRIQFKQFRFRDAVAEKGDAARIHFGAIAQEVKAAFEAEGLDPFKYGVLCYDEWADQFEDVLDEDGTPTGEKLLVKTAGNRYGVRYDELFALKLAALEAL